MEKIGLVAIFDVQQFNKGLDQYTDGIDTANDATKDAEDQSFSFTRALEVFVGNALVKVGELALEAAGKVIEFGKESVALAADFETQMTILQTAASDTDMSVSEWGDTMIAVGGDARILGASATGAAEATTNLLKAGVKEAAVLSNLNDFMEDGEKLTGALASSFDLAAATGLDVGRASEIAAINLATFGNELKDGAKQADFIQFSLDNLVKAADASVAEVADLSEALAVVGPSANAAGMSFQDTTNALALFSTAGITGSRAGTTLEATLRDLRKTTPKAQEMMDKLNISLYDQEGAMLPLIDIVGQFEQATADMTQEQRDQSLQAIFQAQGMRGIQVLLEKGVGGWNKMADAVEGATGIQEQAELRSKTFAGQMESLDGQIETLKIRFGQALLPALGGIAGAFSKLIDEHGPKLEKVFSVIGEVLGELIKSFEAGLTPIETIGEVLDNFLGEDKMDKIWTSLEKTQETFDRVFSTIENTITTIAPIFKAIWGGIQKVIEVAVGTIGETLMPDLVGAFELVKAFDWEAVLKVITTVGIVIGAVFTTLLAVLTGAIRGIAAGLRKAAGLFKDITETINKMFKAFAEKDIKKGVTLFGKILIKGITLPFKVIFKATQEFVKGFLKFFENLRIKLVGRSIIPDMMKDIFAVIKNAYDDIVKITKEWVNNVIGFFEDLARDVLTAWNELWDDVKRIVNDAVKKVEKFIVDLIDTVTRAWDNFVGDIKDAWNNLWEDVKTAVSTAVTNIETTITTFISNIETKWNTFKTNLETAWNALWENVRTAVSTAFENIITLISTGMQNILDTISGFAQDLIDKGAEIVQWIADGILNAIDVLSSAIDGLIASIGTAITNAKDKILEVGATIVGFIKDGLTAAWDAAGGIVDTIGDKFKSLKSDLTAVWVNVMLVGAEVVNKILAGIEGVWFKITDGIKNLIGGDNGILSAIQSAGSTIVNAGGKIVDFLKEGVNNAWDGFVNWIKDKLIGWFNNNPPPSGASSIRSASASSLSGQSLVSSVGDMMTNNSFDNSRNITVEINSTNAPQEPVQIYFDVIAALQAAGV